LCLQVTDENGPASEADGLEEDVPTKKKPKGPSAEEETQDKIIAKLQGLYRCEDHKCSFDFCWPDGATAKHIHLTHLHLRSWSAAIEANEVGVDLETPPNMKIFDTTYSGNMTDMNALAHRRVSSQSHNSPIVNFEGLADVIKQLNPQPTIPAPIPIATASALPRPLRLPPPKMSTADFCAQFDLSPEIRDKLGSINIAGPHLLRLVADGALREEARLDLGELAGVRDAEERWMNELAVVRNSL
jgi:hypothetical protein